jgi:hypothetical protein
MDANRSVCIFPNLHNPFNVSGCPLNEGKLLDNQLKSSQILGFIFTKNRMIGTRLQMRRLKH